MPRGRRRLVFGSLLVLGAAAAFVAFWFQPQKLVIDKTVNDAAPTTVAADGPAVVATGSFRSLDHATSGAVRVVEMDEHAIVRLEEFATDNGPDLFVYLTTNPADGDEDAFDDDFVNLGRLKGNLGDQNYDVPAGTDLGRFRSVVVWCDRFNSAFGAADLALASRPAP